MKVSSHPGRRPGDGARCAGSPGDQPDGEEHQLEQSAGDHQEEPGTRAHVQDAEKVEGHADGEQDVPHETQEGDGPWDQPRDEEQVGEDDYGQEFDSGLSLVLDGVATLLAPEARQPGRG
jgi:hypothetical protein